ncbi:hypothetical protein SAMN02745248_01217 [Hathewaya proteolytica DSM 3090]|uniref:Uncharacterized protein n=1 Tax=Hathewaya proteolytica DSM 3090 TaxID=1121331 RepID=A0A1M6N173_9CLOT|nr:hypothetical protein [Hathewaya proteolytica]SHJ89435.1 hypothetical protein SAMN02745248_01217 [Hathewaya proteolytica DSM 3090]
MLKYFPIDDFVKPVCSTDLQKVMKKSCMNLFSYAFELFKEVEKVCDNKRFTILQDDFRRGFISVADNRFEAPFVIFVKQADDLSYNTMIYERKAKGCGKSKKAKELVEKINFALIAGECSLKTDGIYFSYTKPCAINFDQQDKIKIVSAFFRSVMDSENKILDIIDK